MSGEELNKLTNIGQELAYDLKAIGVNTFTDLKSIGSKDVFLRLKVSDKHNCINTLYAIEGAIQGIRWHHLSPEVKKELKSFFNAINSSFVTGNLNVE